MKAGYNEKGSRVNSARSIANDSAKSYIDKRWKDSKKRLKQLAPT
ncbi:hypothetical protein ACIQ57_00530 [Lysinibacillus xylanilyticus]